MTRAANGHKRQIYALLTAIAQHNGYALPRPAPPARPGPPARHPLRPERFAKNPDRGFPANTVRRPSGARVSCLADLSGQSRDASAQASSSAARTAIEAQVKVKTAYVMCVLPACHGVVMPLGRALPTNGSETVYRPRARLPVSIVLHRMSAAFLVQASKITAKSATDIQLKAKAA